MIIIYILLGLVILAFFMSKFILMTVFGKRCEGNPNLKYFTANDFEELEAKKVEFKSNKGQMLRGNIYTSNNIKEYKGLIVFVHGMGGAGHLSYTTEINTFAQNGLIVLGYDNTGTCSSEGKNIKGFFQSVIDLKFALKYISENEELNKYNVVLVGHSWGAYTVCQELAYSKNVKAVVSLSGFNNSSRVITDSMKNMTKINFTFLRPFITIINFFTFGKDAIKNTADILRKTDVPVLALHGNTDTSVEYANSLVAQELEDKANIKTVIYDGKVHNVYQTRESEKYLNDTFGEITNLRKKHKGKIPEDEAKRIYGSIDYKKITEEDKEVMDTIIKFIEDKIEERV